MSPSSPPQVPGHDVLAPIGEGASSTVWRGRRRADGMAVALKVVRPVRGDVDAALREAGLLAAVRHRHVVHLYDVLPLVDEASGRPGSVVLVTQLAAGGSLAQLLGRRRILSPGELVTVLQPLAGALADLHVRGVVHGDLSTGNVLFRADGMPLLADLGTARVAGEPRGAAWGTGAGEGMVAPEVLEGFAATAESDVYQLGALARLALTGEPPGPGHDRVPLVEAAPELDPALVELVTRCMAPQPEDRPDAEELATVLMGVAVPEPVEVAPDADPAHGLTRRLRQLAQEDAAALPQVEARRWWDPRGWRGRQSPAGGAEVGLDEAPVPVRRAGAHRPSQVDRGDRVAHARRVAPGVRGDNDGRPDEEVARRRSNRWAVAGLFLVSAVVGAVLFLTLGGPVRDLLPLRASTSTGDTVAPSDATGGTVGRGDDADPNGVPVGTSPTSTGDPVGGSSAPSGATAGTSPDATSGTVGPGEAAGATSPAPQTQIHADVQAVIDARASAWEATDPALLVRAMAADSPALAVETDELERAQAAQVSYHRVAFTVQDVEVVEREGERLRVNATVARAALEVRDDDGWLLRTPERVDEVELELVRQDDRWLLWSWTDEVR